MEQTALYSINRTGVTLSSREHFLNIVRSESRYALPTYFISAQRLSERRSAESVCE
jgi:hypothetical protein